MVRERIALKHAVLWALALGCFWVGDARAQTPNVMATVTLDKAQYFLGPSPPAEVIKLAITIRNNTGAPIIVPVGFASRAFELTLLFKTPDGRLLAPIEASQIPEPGPCRGLFDPAGEFVCVDEVEVVLPGGVITTNTLSVTVSNAGQFYPGLLRTHAPPAPPGRWEVRALIPMVIYGALDFTVDGSTFARLTAADGTTPNGTRFLLESNTVAFMMVTDDDGDGKLFPVEDCNDANPAIPGPSEIPNNGLDDDCNPATLDVPPPPTVTPATIHLQAVKHTVGTGSKPGSTKSPIVGAGVRAFSKGAGSCAAGIGVSWQKYKSIWLTCTPDAIGTTGSTGMADLSVPPGEYVALAQYDPDAVPLNNNELYIGTSAGPLTSGQTENKFVQVIVDGNGNIIPAKYTKMTGSELLVIEPEYIEWSGTQALYPFVFESIGDWTVKTTVSPPEGFVADNSFLTEEVNTDRKVVQFTLTDVGSKWVGTNVTYDLTHKGKKEKVKSKIGVKLSKKLAQQKGLTRFGQPVGVGKR